MKALRWMTGLSVLAVFCLLHTTPASAQAAAPAGGAQPKYTMAEYNSYQAAAAEKNPAAQIKLLDDFIAKYPASALLNYIYPLYYKNYFGQKNYPKAIEYADKMIAMGDKATPTELYDAYYVRAYAYNAIQNPDAETAKAARTSALAALKALDQVPKPDGVDDAKFKEEKKQSTMLFLGTAANAGLAAKDYPGAIESYKAVLASTPDDLISNYNIGKSYMAMVPPQPLDALWYYARAASSKTANEQQSKSIKTYVRKLIANYQGGTVCDALTDAEMNELLQLAPNSVDRPASYKLFSSADLDVVRKDMTVASVVTDLKAGGDKAKLVWTAACGLEFPEVPTKVLELTPGDTIVIKGAFVTSDAEFEAASVSNMEFKIAGQAEAGKIEKDAFVHITGTLQAYDPDPAFMLHWDKAKVKDDDLPKEKGPVKKPVAKKPAAKKPGKS